MDEFTLIEKYFTHLTATDPDVVLGIGDDAAVIMPPAGQQLIVSTDSLVAGVHFMPQWPAAAIGHRALAVNLSDMAAMGAIPRWVTVALTLPERDESWLKSFCEGFAALAHCHQVSLVGGNIARGSLNITLTIMGLASKTHLLRRDQAQVGDVIYVTGELGSAALAVRYLSTPGTLTATDEPILLQQLLYPQPRINHGVALAGVANAGIDLSDGLAADLGHILQRSKVGARLTVAQLPVNPIVLNYLTQQQAWELALTGGDDYELCFTVAPAKVMEVEQMLTRQQLAFYPLGVIEAQPGLRCALPDGQLLNLSQLGFQHF